MHKTSGTSGSGEETYIAHIGAQSTRVTYADPISTVSGLQTGGTLLVFDQNTVRLFPEELIPSSSLTLPPGERAKQWQSVDTILSAAVSAGIGRDGCLVGIGGGVVCDLTAFAASIYLRGISLILVPTTVLSMVDASLGGKTGMDYMGYKNLVGTFYPAGEVRVCVEFVSTLPEREYRSGLAEVIKHAFLGDRQLYDHLWKNRDKVLRRDLDSVRFMIERSILLKGDIVESDPREEGVRAHLNLGHTFGHALEAVAGFTVSHGECVAWGIAKAMQAGKDAGITDPGYADDVRALLREYDFRLDFSEVPAGDIVEAMSRDKKRASNRVRFVLQKRLGETVVMPLEPELVTAVLNRA